MRGSARRTHDLAPRGPQTRSGKRIEASAEVGKLRAQSAESAKRTRTCEMNPAGLALLETWIHYHRSLWERRLDRLGALLSTET